MKLNPLKLFALLFSLVMGIGSASAQATFEERIATWNFRAMEKDAVSINGTTGTVPADIEGVELAVNATSGKLVSRGSDAQFNQGAIISVPVRHAGDVVTVVSYPNYHFYTIAGTAAANDTETYTAVKADATAGKVDIVATATAYLYSISVKQIAYSNGDDDGGDDDSELKEQVVYSTKFQDWEKQSASSTPFNVTKTTTDGQELTFTFTDTAIDPEGTNSKFNSDCVTTGYFQTDKKATASVVTSPLTSITKLELVQAATGGTRGITIYVKGDGDADWVEIHNKSIVTAGGETLAYDINRTNCQIKFGAFATSQNAYVTSLKISGNVKVAKRTFTDFKVDFRIKDGEQAYTVVSPAEGLPEGVTVNPGSYNGGQHGAQNPTVTVKVDGPVKFTIGSCQFGSHTVTVKNGSETIATVDNNNGCENGYTTIESCTYDKYVTYTYNNETPATLTFSVNGYCPFFIAEKTDFIPSVTVTYFDTDGKTRIGEKVIEGGSDLVYAYGADDVTVADGKAFRGWFDGKAVTACKVAEGTAVTADLNLFAKATDIEVATVGSVFNYDLTKKNFYQEDHELIEMTGSYYNNHGWIFGANQTIKLQVAGNAIVNFALCQFGNAGTIVATDAAGNQVGEAITTPVSADGGSASISYNGNATTLTFTLTNGGYVHGVKVFNVTEIPEKNDAGYYVVKPNDGAGLLLLLASAQAGDKIFLPNGTYDFGETTCTTIGVNNLSIIGESMEGTIIKTKALEEKLGVADLFYNTSTGLYMQDLTLQNDFDYYNSGSAGRAAVLQDNGNQTILRNVAMRSYQDTYYSKSGNYYFEGGLIQGTVDYICGGGNAWFENITLLNKSRSATAKSGDDTMTAYQGTGKYIFNNSSVESECQTFNFGRSWADAYVVYLNTTIKSGKLVDSRFSTADMNSKPRFFGEYNTEDLSGNGMNTPVSNHLTTSKGGDFESVLTAEQAAAYTLESLFGTWDPKTIAAQADADIYNIDENALYLVEDEGEFVAIIKGSDFTADVINKTIRKANGRGGFGEPVKLEIKTVDVTIDEYKYITFYNESAVLIPGEDVPVYAKAVYYDENANKFVLADAYEPGDVIPAKTPVVLYSETPGTYSLVLTSMDNEAPANNDLIGSAEDTETDELVDGDPEDYYYYALSLSKDNEIGFYWMNPEGAAFTNGAGKAFLAVKKSVFDSESNLSKAMGFAFNEGANAIHTASMQKTAKVYDITGREVKNPAKGVYIVGGKKVIKL